jgi:hypothetical protein
MNVLMTIQGKICELEDMGIKVAFWKGVKGDGLVQVAEEVCRSIRPPQKNVVEGMEGKILDQASAVFSRSVKRAEDYGGVWMCVGGKAILIPSASDYPVALEMLLGKQNKQSEQGANRAHKGQDQEAERHKRICTRLALEQYRHADKESPESRSDGSEQAARHRKHLTQRSKPLFSTAVGCKWLSMKVCMCFHRFRKPVIAELSTY